jgi:SAM-dependent methyltransferase
MNLEALLACPVCHAALDGVACTSCGRTYSRDGGVYDLTPVPPPDAEVQARWGLWEVLQANGEKAYEIDPPSSLSVGERADAAAFAAFAQLDGTVLDVGCGPQTMPSYALGMPGELVGIDPLTGVRPRKFAFVKGIAEYLPFADATFDCVLFATSLDHVLSPSLTLAEARRVTKPGGAVVVWAGEQAQPSLVGRLRSRARRLLSGPERSTVVETPNATMTFDVPEGAVDAFHVAHPDPNTISGWLRAAALRVEAVERPLAGHAFIRAVR